MNWEAVGGCGEITTAIAMIGTLVYFARELRLSIAHSIRSGYD